MCYDTLISGQLHLIRELRTQLNRHELNPSELISRYVREMITPLKNVRMQNILTVLEGCN